MTRAFGCEDREQLVALLYGEADGDERAAIEAHLATCPACASEYAALREVRTTLTAWQPPDTELGFRIVREPRPVRRWWHVPAWAPTALAAVLLLAVGAALSQVQIEYGDGTVVLRTAWSPAPERPTATPREPVQPAPAVVPVSAGMPEEEVRAALADLEQRLRGVIAAERTAAVPADRDDILRRVESMIEASERRQQRELALRLAQVVRDVDTQRRADLVRIEQGMGELQGLTGRQAEQMINYLMRTSAPR
ncbi:MAG TPA: zf-HC2 domain-containing protein [Vicinamibacterales bacterium]